MRDLFFTKMDIYILIYIHAGKADVYIYNRSSVYVRETQLLARISAAYLADRAVERYCLLTTKGRGEA